MLADMVAIVGRVDDICIFEDVGILQLLYDSFYDLVDCLQCLKSSTVKFIVVIDGR